MVHLKGNPVQRTQRQWNELFTAVFALVAGLALWAPITFWKGYVFVKLWSWFVTPLNPADLPPPSIFTAVGVMIVVCAFLPRPGDRDESKSAMYTIMAGIGYPLGLLGAGAFWHWLHWGV
jgi:hypothetical protein